MGSHWCVSGRLDFPCSTSHRLCTHSHACRVLQRYKTLKTLFQSSLCVKAYDERAGNRPASQYKIRGPLTRSHAVNSDSWGWLHTIWYDCDLRPHEWKTTSHYRSWAELGWNKLQGLTFHRIWNQINVSEIETWISVLGCKSGGRSEEWSDSIQHWQKTYSFFFSEDNQRDETFLLSYPTICCMHIQGLLCNLTPVSWNKRSVSMVSRTQRSSEKATPPSWVPLLNLLTQHRVRNGISVQYVHYKQFNSKTNASSPRGDLK